MRKGKVNTQINFRVTRGTHKKRLQLRELLGAFFRFRKAGARLVPPNLAPNFVHILSMRRVHLHPQTIRTRMQVSAWSFLAVTDIWPAAVCYLLLVFRGEDLEANQCVGADQHTPACAPVCKCV